MVAKLYNSYTKVKGGHVELKYSTLTPRGGAGGAPSGARLRPLAGRVRYSVRFVGSARVLYRARLHQSEQSLRLSSRPTRSLRCPLPSVERRTRGGRVAASPCVSQGKARTRELQTCYPGGRVGVE